MQKYKVFLNEKRILFTSFSKITLSGDKFDLPDFKAPAVTAKWLSEFEHGEEQEVVFESADSKKHFADFYNSLLCIDAAGGVVRKDNRLLFIFRNDKWDLPKGKIEKGETVEEAAIREVQEECGIEELTVEKQQLSTYHIYRSPYNKSFGQWIFKKTFWFEMNYSGSENGIPQKEEGISEVRWFKPSELNEVLENTYANLKPLIEIYRD